MCCIVYSSMTSWGPCVSFSGMWLAGIATAAVDHIFVSPGWSKGWSNGWSKGWSKGWSRVG